MCPADGGQGLDRLAKQGPGKLLVIQGRFSGKPHVAAGSEGLSQWYASRTVGKCPVTSTPLYYKHVNTDIIQLDSIIPADGMFPEVTIRDVMNTTGGHLCYVYE